MGSVEGGEAVTGEHQHYWRIESPGVGKHILQGICLGCGITRRFTGSISKSKADSTRSAARKLKGEDVARDSEGPGPESQHFDKLKTKVNRRVRGKIAKAGTREDSEGDALRFFCRYCPAVYHVFKDLVVHYELMHRPGAHR